jgi:ribosomal protein L3 glutamine methyltransferase
MVKILHHTFARCTMALNGTSASVAMALKMMQLRRSSLIAGGRLSRMLLFSQATSAFGTTSARHDSINSNASTSNDRHRSSKVADAASAGGRYSGRHKKASPRSVNLDEETIDFEDAEFAEPPAALSKKKAQEKFLQFPPFNPKEIDKSYMHMIYTVGDMYNRAAEWFANADLAYGHCTMGPEEDAAFMILHLNKRPVVENINNHRQVILTPQEKKQMLEVIYKRISTRKPIAYLLGVAIQHGEMFVVNENVLIPRSFIGDIICDFTSSNEIVRHFGRFGNENGSATSDSKPKNRKPSTNRMPLLRSALDMCTGSGALAILLAKRFPFIERIDACDISPEAIAVARQNIVSKKLDKKITLFEGDLFGALDKVQASEMVDSGDHSTSALPKYDLIVCNPPYVKSELMGSLPPEYKSEPALALDGGKQGMVLTTRILKDCVPYLNQPHGLLILEIGNAQKHFRTAFPYLSKFTHYIETDAMDSAGEVIAIPASALATAFSNSSSYEK